MAFDLTRLGVQLDGMLRMLPVSCVHESQTLNGCYTTLRSERKQELYGYDDEITFSVMFRFSDFDSAITNNDTIAVDGVTYRIMGHEKDAAGVAVRLDLGNLVA